MPPSSRTCGSNTAAEGLSLAVWRSLFPAPPLPPPAFLRHCRGHSHLYPISPSWLHACGQTGRLADKPHRLALLAGLRISVTGLPESERLAVAALCAKHGASFHAGLTLLAGSSGATGSFETAATTTHLLAASGATEKYAAAVQSGHVKVVRPSWLRDTIFTRALQDDEDRRYRVH
eukprot:SAG31_NODE_430_length_15792_cov_15.908558_14_plen_176_part_00